MFVEIKELIVAINDFGTTQLRWLYIWKGWVLKCVFLLVIVERIQ